jgi:hypothetical protein
MAERSVSRGRKAGCTEVASGQITGDLEAEIRT